MSRQHNNRTACRVSQRHPILNLPHTFNHTQAQRTLKDGRSKLWQNDYLAGGFHSGSSRICLTVKNCNPNPNWNCNISDRSSNLVQAGNYCTSTCRPTLGSDSHLYWSFCTKVLTVFCTCILNISQDTLTSGWALGSPRTDPSQKPAVWKENKLCSSSLEWRITTRTRTQQQQGKQIHK